MADETVDVLIIGAGASGAAMAWSLAETKMHIVCLEQGGLMNPLAYPSTGRDWEARSTSDFATNPNVRGLPTDYPINEDDSPIKVANFNGVGGGTVLYAGHFPRFHPSDFRTKSLDGVGDDWPIDYNQLAPYYAENEKMTGVAGLNGDPAYPSDNAPRLPPLPLGDSGKVLAKGFNALGWHWWPSDTAIITEDYDGRAGCINLGACGAGCAQGAKGSADVTYWPHAQRAGVELRTRCRVREITVGDDGMATGARYVNAKGEEREIAAHVVVVACNGIGTPRLLLNSKSPQHPDGLANSSGLVGKSLMVHSNHATWGVMEEEIRWYKGPPSLAVCEHWNYQDEGKDFLGGYSFMSQGPLPTDFATALVTNEGVYGTRLRKWMAHYNHMAGLKIVGETLPQEENRVELADEPDALGLPLPKVTFSYCDNDRRLFRHAQAFMGRMLEAAGAQNLYETESTAHLMGGCRMGDDPRTSVVGADGRSWDIDNLFVCDGSLFPTAGGVNPSMTIVANSLRIADRIIELGRRGELR